MSNSSNIGNQTPYLPNSRTFETADEDELERDLTKMYTDVSMAINLRGISIFDTTAILTGETWFNNKPLSGNTQFKRQTFRKVFSIGAVAAGATLTTAHGITNLIQMSRIYGTVTTDAPDFRPVPYASATAVNQQIELKVNTTNFILINGAGAPNITIGVIILEWLAS